MMYERLRGGRVTTILVAGGMLAGAGLMPVAAIEPSGGSTTGGTGESQHFLRSGLVTVQGSGQKVTLSAANATDTAEDIDLKLFDTTGNVLTKKAATVQPGAVLTLSYDPPSSTKIRGQVSIVAFVCNGIVSSLEVAATSDGGPHLVLDHFTDEDRPLAF